MVFEKNLFNMPHEPVYAYFKTKIDPLRYLEDIKLLDPKVRHKSNADPAAIMCINKWLRHVNIITFLGSFNINANT